MDSVYSLGCGFGPSVIDSKGAAMMFAVLMSSTYCANSSTRRINYKKAKKLFDFICSNIDLPEVRPDCIGFADAIIKSARDFLNLEKKGAET